VPHAQPRENRDWRARLADLVRLSKEWEFPWKAYRPRPPSGRPWPKGLPASATLRDFYALCDGGPFSGLGSWLRLRELRTAAKNMAAQIEQDRKELGDHVGPFVMGRHLVLATDPDGFPLIWDSETDLLAWYQPLVEGGSGWYPLHVALDESLRRLFFPEPGATFAADEMWLEVIRRLEHLT
jgi:hypothetical protein